MIRNKKGFTLVELLAVIVILAVILVIAVPQIIKTIDESRNGAFISSAKLIAASAEREYLARKTLDDTSFQGLDSIPCAEVAEVNDNDYEDCTVTFDSNGKAKVTLVGKGKFAGKNICDGTRTSANVTEDACGLVCEAGTTKVVKSVTPVMPYEVKNVKSCEDYFKNYFINNGASQENASGGATTLCGGGTLEGMTFPQATELLIAQNLLTEQDLIDNNVIKVTIEEECITLESCFAFDPTEGAITGYNGECGTNIKIPKTIDGVDVVKIGEYAFTSLGEEVTMLSTNKEYSVDYLQNNNSDAEVMPIVTVACEGYGITNVVIPEGITTIGSNAFENNPITSLQLPSSIVEIGYRAFSGNEISGLLDLSSNTNLTVIGSFAFEGDYTTSIKLPLNIETIPMEAFAGMNISGLLDLSGYSNLTTIEKNAFKYNNISEIKLPSSITKIETGAFSKIGNLSNINLTKIINPTGKGFDWDSIIYDNGKGLLNTTGTFSGVVVSSS